MVSRLNPLPNAHKNFKNRRKLPFNYMEFVYFLFFKLFHGATKASSHYHSTPLQFSFELSFFKAVFTDAADWTAIILRHIFPFGAGSDSVIGITFCFVINIAADAANIFFHKINTLLSPKIRYKHSTIIIISQKIKKYK